MFRRFRTVAFQVSVSLLAVMLCAPSVNADPAEDYEKGVQAYNSGDLIVAMRYLERAAQAGHAGAQVRYGYILDKAEENEEAMKYYRLAAEAGDAEGAYSLGTMYANGDGVERDYAQARSWYEQAAENGHVEALETLGIAHHEGALGLDKDPEYGRQLLQRAADIGSENARQLLDNKYGQSTN